MTKPPPLFEILNNFVVFKSGPQIAPENKYGLKPKLRTSFGVYVQLLRAYYYYPRLSVLTIWVTLFTLFTFQAHAAFNCRKALTPKVYFERNQSNAESNYFYPNTYLKEKSLKDISGVVETQFSAQYDTRFYFTATSKKTDPNRPFEIDPKSRAVYIFFHGSGTAQSSGKNFVGNMNILAKLGFSSLSFDLPFHGDGPMSHKYDDVNFFMNWIHSIVQEVKKAGKPVYLVGHSFGPDVIAEYITRFPFGVHGALLMSPAGFNKVLSNWYDKKTSKMNFGGDVQENDAGGTWAGLMSSQFLWNKFSLADPTQVNPYLKVHLLSGDREEYAPAPVGGPKKTPIGPNTYNIGNALKVFFKKVSIVIEIGVGHYIFSHTDANGFNAVTREILRVAGFRIEDSKKLSDEMGALNSQMSYSEKLLTKYSYDGNFKSFINHYIGEKPFRNAMQGGNEFLAKNISDQYDTLSKVYENKILEYILGSSPAVTEFQQENAAMLELVRKDLKTRSAQAITAFTVYLDYKSPAQAAEVLKDFNYQYPEKIVNIKR